MSTLVYILLFTFLGSIAALIGGFILLSKEKFALKASHFLSSFAAGVLLSSAFLDLLPEAMHEAEESDLNVSLWVLIGIVLFFLLERTIHWFHHHEDYQEHEKETKSTVPLIIIGDTVHNFVDGIVIAATFLVSAPLGIVTALAVAAHEIPQEIGDFGLLLHKGLSRKRVFLVNIVSAGAAFLGAIMMYILGEKLEGKLPILLAVTSGFFVYIATSDLIPEIHHEKKKRFAILQSILFSLGIVVIFVSVSVLSHEN